jgi:hypothetical protein
MSMMINPSGGGQIIAAGQPFKLKLKKKRPAAEPAETTEPAEPEDTAEAATDADEQDEDADS